MVSSSKLATHNSEKESRICRTRLRSKTPSIKGKCTYDMIKSCLYKYIIPMILMTFAEFTEKITMPTKSVILQTQFTLNTYDPPFSCTFKPNYYKFQ